MTVAPVLSELHLDTSSHETRDDGVCLGSCSRGPDWNWTAKIDRIVSAVVCGENRG
jgi:hypothetical protein